MGTKLDIKNHSVHKTDWGDFDLPSHTVTDLKVISLLQNYFTSRIKQYKSAKLVKLFNPIMNEHKKNQGPFPIKGACDNQMFYSITSLT